jgi:hypothetical protein
MSDKITRDELEELEGEVLPERAAMSIVDTGSTLLGFHGPIPDVPLPDDPHAPLEHPLDDTPPED